MNEFTCWTDGASKGNPGPSGWAIYLDGEVLSGGFPYATNNEAEVYAAYQAVLNVPDNSKLKIITDSKMVVGWLSSRWAMNVPQIRALAGLYFTTMLAKHVIVDFELVKGHSGVPGNEIVDKAASREASLQRSQLDAKRTAFCSAP